MRGTEHVVLRFDTWREFVLAADGPTDCDAGRRTSRRAGSKGDGFHGDTTWESSLEMAKHGWAGPRQDVKDLTDKVKTEIKASFLPTIEQQYHNAGSMVNVPRFLNGNPKCMVRNVPIVALKTNKVINLLVCLSASGGIDESEITKRGLAICALIECLELSQHSVELWVEQTVTSDIKLTTLVKVKQATDSLDIDKVMFAVAHPTMLRRMIFSLEECQPYNIRRAIGCGDGGSGYGMPHKLTQQDAVNATVALDMMSYRREDKFGANAGEWIKEELGKLGLIID